MAETPHFRQSRGVWGVGILELSSGLLWPRLLGAARLALRPARIGLSLVMLALIGLIGQIPSLWLAGDKRGAGPLADGSLLAGRALEKIAYGVLRLVPEQAGAGLLDLFVDLPKQLIDKYPWGSLAVFVPALIVWTIGGGAVARTAATEFALDRRISWTRALAFSLSRWGSLFSSLAAPLFVVGILVGLMALLGGALLGFQYLNAVGALLYFIVLLLGVAAVVVLVVYLLGMPMLVPAVACEGTDAIDSVQRCYAYVTGRPMRVVAYSAVLLVQAVVATVVLGALAKAADSLALWSSTLLLAQPWQGTLRAHADGSPLAPGEVSRTAAAAVSAVRFWAHVPLYIVGAFAISFWFSGGTVLYLLIRQLCDGQDTDELWTPGVIAGTHAGEEATVEGEGGEESPES